MKLKTGKYLLIAAAAFQLFLSGCAASKKLGSGGYFKNFPEGSTPEEIGRRVANRFLAVPHQNFGRPGPAYLDRKRIVGDMHSQAPVLWCAAALLR